MRGKTNDFKTKQNKMLTGSVVLNADIMHLGSHSKLTPR